jgi:hypothetical protein
MSVIRRLPPRYAPVVMPLILSVLMTFVVSAISTLKSLAPTPAFLVTWPTAWPSPGWLRFWRSNRHCGEPRARRQPGTAAVPCKQSVVQTEIPARGVNYLPASDSRH